MARLTIQGGKELAEALTKLSTRLSRRIVLECLREAAEPIRKSAAARAPYLAPGTVHLRNEMRIATSRGQDRNEMAVAVGPSKAGFYGGYQELGTAHHAAQPFITPALDENAQKSLKILASSLWRELARRGIWKPTQTVESIVEDLGQGDGLPGGGRAGSFDAWSPVE